MTIASTLAAAADLVERPGAWTQGECARNVSGVRTLIRGDQAVCFCMAGAIVRMDNNFKAFGFAHRAMSQIIECWNDAPDRTQAQVVAKLRELSALAAKQGV